MELSERAARLMVLAGLAGMLPAGLIWGMEEAFSFLAGSLWAALNFLLLVDMLAMITARSREAKRFVFLMVCAKIPASYFILCWIFTRDYFSPAATAAGLTTFLVVLFVYGLAAGGRSSEEGKERSG